MIGFLASARSRAVSAIASGAAATVLGFGARLAAAYSNTSCFSARTSRGKVR